MWICCRAAEHETKPKLQRYPASAPFSIKAHPQSDAGTLSSCSSFRCRKEAGNFSSEKKGTLLPFIRTLPTVGQVRNHSRSVNVHITDILNTNYQPLTYVRVSRPRIATSDASQKTRRRRSNQLAGIRDTVSGGKSSAQLQDELDKEGRDKLLSDEAFCREISPEEALSLKSTHGFPWNKIRNMRRYKKTYKQTSLHIIQNNAGGSSLTG